MQNKNLTCPICKGESKMIFPGNTLLDRFCNVFSCCDCGLVFLERDTSIVNVQEEEPYWKWESQEEIYSDGVIQREFSREYIDCLSQIECYAKGRRLLDFGCGTGIFLEVARDRGWDCFGIDISSRAVQLARERLNLPIQAGVLENGLFSNEKFDVVTMWDVIEHLYDPIRTLRKVYSRLNKDGILVIKTPDENYLFRKINKLLFKVSLGRINFLPKYFYYQTHLFYFSIRTLSNLLNISGPFNIIQIRHSSTNIPFLKEKLKVSYSHKSKFFYKIIPNFIRFVSRLGLDNKLIVYSRKI